MRSSGQYGLLALAAVDARLGRRLGDRDRRVFQPRRPVVSAVSERVLEVVLVIALLELVEPRVRAARFLALQRAVRDSLGDLEREAELDRAQPFGVEGAVAVVELEAARIALAQRGELAAGRLHALRIAVNADAGLHDLVHLVADRRDTISALASDEAEEPRFDRLRLPARGIALARWYRFGVVGCTLAGNISEHHELRERVGAEAIGAVDAHARALACRVQALERRLGLAVAEDAAHRVVHRG